MNIDVKMDIDTLFDCLFRSRLCGAQIAFHFKARYPCWTSRALKEHVNRRRQRLYIPGSAYRVQGTAVHCCT